MITRADVALSGGGEEATTVDVLQLAAKSMDERPSYENEGPELGKNAEDKEKLTEAISILVEQAVMKGFPAEYANELQRIACRFDIWRLSLGTDPPAKVPPMKIRLTVDAKPYRCKARKYPPELRRFMEDFNNELEQLGWIYENPNSRWACCTVGKEVSVRRISTNN